MVEGLDLLCRAYNSNPSHPGVVNMLAHYCLLQGDYAKVGSKRHKASSESCCPLSYVHCAKQHISCRIATITKAWIQSSSDAARHTVKGECRAAQIKAVGKVTIIMHVARLLQLLHADSCLSECPLAANRSCPTAQAKQLAQHGQSVAETAAVEADSLVQLARAHHALSEWQDAFKAYGQAWPLLQAY